MRLLPVAFVFLMISGTGALADWSSIKIGTDGLYPPWNARTDNGQFEGFEIDLADDLCERMKANCAFVNQRWDGILPALTTGKYDLVMAGIEITSEREKLVDFSTCYAAEVAVFAVRSDNALAGTITPAARVNLTGFSSEAQSSINALRQALAGTTVGVQVATDHADFVKQYLLDLVDVRYFDTLENLTRDLDAGQIDAALSSRGYWQRAMAGEPSLDLALIGPDMMGDVFGRGIGVAFRQQDGDLRAKVNDAIEAARADGTIAELSKRWFGYDLSC
jgi:octopine/nopaline transport system substrate-binding protein